MTTQIRCTSIKNWASSHTWPTLYKENFADPTGLSPHKKRGWLTAPDWMCRQKLCHRTIQSGEDSFNANQAIYRLVHAVEITQITLKKRGEVPIRWVGRFALSPIQSGEN